jgi:hypothetical protein
MAPGYDLIYFSIFDASRLGNKCVDQQVFSRGIVLVTTQSQSTQKKDARDLVLTWCSVRLIRYEV